MQNLCKMVSKQNYSQETGTDLDFKQNYPRVFSEALKKNRGSCKLNEH